MRGMIILLGTACPLEQASPSWIQIPELKHASPRLWLQTASYLVIRPLRHCDGTQTTTELNKPRMLSSQRVNSVKISLLSPCLG